MCFQHSYYTALDYLEGLQLPDCLLCAALKQLRECRVKAVYRIIPKLLGGHKTCVLHGLVVLLPSIVVDLPLVKNVSSALASFKRLVQCNKFVYC